MWKKDWTILGGRYFVDLEESTADVDGEDRGE